MSAKKYVTTRTLTREEYPWLSSAIQGGTVLYAYMGATYGCCSHEGVPLTMDPSGGAPFFEVPWGAVKEHESTPIVSGGGPAFPYAFHLPDAPGEPSGVNLGMSLRDWFAGNALAGILANSNTQCEQGKQRALVEAAASLAFEAADAMLRERAKP